MTCPIKPEEVTRTGLGFFTHSQFPNWDEGTENSTINAWCIDNHCVLSALYYFDDASEEEVEAYLEDCSLLSQWNPTPPHQAALVFSIHDTEDGPVCIFLIPKEYV